MNASTQKPRIAIIGAGNMGSALLGGLIAEGHPPQGLFASHPSADRIKQLAEQFHVQTTTSNLEAALRCEVLVFCVEPNTVPTVCEELAPCIQKNAPLVISIAAGVPEETIQHLLGGQVAIIRAMPNTASLVGSGATALYPNPYVSAEQKKQADTLLRSIGMVVWLNDEKLLDAVTALSGSGPAYYFLMMEIMQDIGVQLGLPEDVARTLALQTAWGAAKMALASGQDVATLRQQVTSRGGTTEIAIEVLESKHVRDIFLEALSMGHRRAAERSEQFKNKFKT